ncbi:MAG: hypothetical protein N3A38_06085 [Planctomycetota bacterium]|nr:hypothetical protein [Planctomycetota bacterium]
MIAFGHPAAADPVRRISSRSPPAFFVIAATLIGAVGIIGAGEFRAGGTDGTGRPSYGAGAEAGSEELSGEDRRGIHQTLAELARAFLDGSEDRLRSVLSARIGEDGRQRILDAFRNEIRTFRYVEFCFSDILSAEAAGDGKLAVGVTLRYRAYPRSRNSGLRTIEDDTSTALTVLKEGDRWKVLDARWFAVMGRTSAPFRWTVLVGIAGLCALALTFWGGMFLASYRERIGDPRAGGWWRSWRFWVAVVPFLGATAFFFFRWLPSRLPGRTR